MCCKNACPDRAHSVWLTGNEYSASPTCTTVGQKYTAPTKQRCIKQSISCNLMQTQQLMQGGRIPLPAQGLRFCSQSCGNSKHFGKAARPSYTGEKSFCSGISSTSGSQPFPWAGLWKTQCSTSVTRLLVLSIRAGLQLNCKSLLEVFCRLTSGPGGQWKYFTPLLKTKMLKDTSSN